ncbi:conserved hypothetical protein [Lasallia pustulata]|uniref:ELYS-like domain-containing protein n=1 Tax=Lasallia pustulata TaxID=136370 RepID=A0A1W5DDE1_9LECA|nr:conserved hypothetical protein [Lasallia pustulata]
MEDFEQFEAVFAFNPDIAYDHQTVDHVLRNRRALENELFFDRLLKALGVSQASKLYPPRSNQDLRTLHGRIVSSASPDHHKQSLLYYILKDFPHSSQVAEGFAKDCFLPSKYWFFIDGLWFLDRLRFEKALDHLTEPALVPTFPQEILYTLCRHAPKDNATLPLAYFYTVSPSITSNKALEALFEVMCRASITEAFYFSRAQGDLIHRTLMENLIGFIHSSTAGDIRAARAMELSGLPLTEEEELWLEEYLLEGKGRTLPAAKDTLRARQIVSGRLQDALGDSKEFNGRKQQGTNWMALKGTLKQGSESRFDITAAGFS